MMDFSELKTVIRPSVVILGNFNPAILHPEWFDRNQILPPSEVRGISQAKKSETKEIEEGLQIKFVSSNVYVSGIDTRLNLPSYKIKVTPERFEASTSKKDKFEELIKFVGATFKILEHTPVRALGINFISSLRFSIHATDLMQSLFCADQKKISSVFQGDPLIDSRIRYNYKDSRVTLLLETKLENDEIGINFNYHKDFEEKEGTKEIIQYLLDNFELMILNADKIITDLFGEPIYGGEINEKPSTDSQDR